MTKSNYDRFVGTYQAHKSRSIYTAPLLGLLPRHLGLSHKQLGLLPGQLGLRLKQLGLGMRQLGLPSNS